MIKVETVRAAFACGDEMELAQGAKNKAYASMDGYKGADFLIQCCDNLVKAKGSEWDHLPLVEKMVWVAIEAYGTGCAAGVISMKEVIDSTIAELEHEQAD